MEIDTARIMAEVLIVRSGTILYFLNINAAVYYKNQQYLQTIEVHFY